MSQGGGRTVRPLQSVHIFADIDALSRDAAGRFADASSRSIAAHGRFTVALSGGSTPRGLYRLLGNAPYSDSIEWQRVHLFWADERCVPPDHEASNFKLAFETFISKVRIPTEHVHRITGEVSAEIAAERYEVCLRQCFGDDEWPVFDLILLGMGEDGHTASLFPGSAALREQVRLAVAVRKSPPDADRVSLTLPVLNRAQLVLMLVSDAAKARVLRSVLDENESETLYPAAMVRPVEGTLEWLIDKPAARLLSKYRSSSDT